jgi:hypothetical protein
VDFFPSKRYSAELTETCFQLFLRERSLKEISQLQNIPYGTLRGWSMRGKWQARRDVLQGKIGKPIVIVESNDETGNTTTGRLDAAIKRALDARMPQDPTVALPVIEEKDKASLVLIEQQKEETANTLELELQRSERRLRMTFDEKQVEYHNKASLEALRILDAIAQTPTDELVQRADKISKLDAVARKALALEEHKPTVVVNVGLLNDLSQRRTLKAAHVATVTLEEQAQDSGALVLVES